MSYSVASPELGQVRAGGRLDIGRVNNVDLWDCVDIGGKQEIVVAATNRTTWDDRRALARPRQRSSHPVARRPHLAGLRRGPVRPLPLPQRGDRRPDVVSALLDPRYPMGLLVVLDGVNLAPDASRANRNFKLVSWPDVLAALRPSYEPE